MLQYLAGRHTVKMTQDHRAAMDDLLARYQTSVQQRETALDDIALAMSQLAASSKAPAGSETGIPIRLVDGAPSPDVPPATQQSVPVRLAPENQDKCTNCKTCYQTLPEIFEITRIVVNGESREVAHLIPDALEHITITPELERRIAYVAANCDAEIIQ
jgi:pyruvate-ferredoxin/flavodoxin oxidoreductase